MGKSHFIVVIAHSMHGRMSRLRVPHYAIHVAISALILGAVLTVGLFSQYVRMEMKSRTFQTLRAEKEDLQRKYDRLVEISDQRDRQLESLGALAAEVSLAFGIKHHTEGGAETQKGLSPSNFFSDSLDKYDFLQQVNLSTDNGTSIWKWLQNTTPSIWPVQGRLSSSFGKRTDPFRGTNSFHAGVDVTCKHGTPIVATADGVVTHSGWFAQYGKRVILDHGRNGLSSLYAHMSEFFVRPGQIVRRGEVIGRVGRTGKATSAHLHYEVRYRGTPLNPYKYLRRPVDSRLGFQTAD